MSLTNVIENYKRKSLLTLINLILLILTVVFLISTMIFVISGMDGISFLVFCVIIIIISIGQVMITYIDVRKDIEILTNKFKETPISDFVKSSYESEEKRRLDIPTPPIMPPKSPEMIYTQSPEQFDNLAAPAVPEPPKLKRKIDLKFNEKVMSNLVNSEDQAEKVVLVNCEVCNEVISISIPKELVINSDLPIVPISYVHYTKKKEKEHCITVYLDHDFDVRRQRISEVIFSGE